MSIDPRGPVLPILCCCLVVLFLIFAMDAAPASVSAMPAASAPPAALPETQKVGITIDFTDSAPDSPVTPVTEIPDSMTAEGVSRIPDVLVRATAVSNVVKNRPSPATRLAAEPASSASRPKSLNPSLAILPPEKPAPTLVPAPPAAPAETRSVPVTQNVAVPAPVSRSLPDNTNWRILSGEIWGRSRIVAPAAASENRSMAMLISGDAIADGFFRSSGDAVLAPGSDAGVVSFHGATGRLGGDESGYWIYLLSGTMDWEKCDGGTIVCSGMRLRSSSQAHFRVTMDETAIRIAVVSGRVRVSGASQPITVNPGEILSIARNGQLIPS